MLAPSGRAAPSRIAAIFLRQRRNFPPAGASRRMDHAMTENRSYLAVVPAYNEEHTIARVIRSIYDAAPHFDVLVVDDASTDSTADRAAETGAHVISRPFNLGIGGAVQSGFVYARENGYKRMVQ